MIRRPALVAAILVTALVACQTTNAPTATQGGPAGSGQPAAATDDAPPTLGPPPSATPRDDTSPVTLDPTLLAFLPESVNGIPLAESVDEATQALSDESLPRIATSVDAAVAVDTASGNLVYAWVVRLRPDNFSDEIYRQWRDSYDEGACSAAGGATRNAEATIDDRTVFITSCAQGLRAYHTWLQEEGILISASAIGDGKFGELLMDNLRVPS